MIFFFVQMRGYYVNKKYLKMKKAAIVIQSNTRRMLERYHALFLLFFGPH